jgi:hypothetical protein
MMMKRKRTMEVVSAKTMMSSSLFVLVAKGVVKFEDGSPSSLSIYFLLHIYVIELVDM